METMNELQNTTGMPAETAASIRRYMEIQREMARLEKEKEQIRDALVKELSGNVPAVWHPMVDGRPLAVTHGHRTMVRYDEQILRERLGEKYAEILEIDGTKIRKNRELVRPLLASVLDRIGTPSAARVETAIKSGALTTEVFRGAFQKTVTPFLSVRIESQPPESPAADAPF